MASHPKANSLKNMEKKTTPTKNMEPNNRRKRKNKTKKMDKNNIKILHLNELRDQYFYLKNRKMP